MIAECDIYRAGVRHPVRGDISDALDASRAHDAESFLWIDLVEPDHDDLTRVSRELDLHPLAVEDAVKARQRPKLERYGEVLFVVVRTLAYVEQTSDVETGEVMLFLGDRFVITIRHGAIDPVGEARARLTDERQLASHGPVAVLYAICDHVVDSYTAIAEEVQDAVTALEERVFSSTGQDPAEAVYSLKREVLEFRSAVAPLVPVTEELLSGRAGVPAETRPFFRDVSDHLMRVAGTIDSLNELLTSVLNAHLAQVGLRQNEDMRRISAWGAILAVPTMVAGIYGMNFHHMPELRWKLGYPLVVGIMVAVCVTLHRLFRRSGWL